MALIEEVTDVSVPVQNKKDQENTGDSNKSDNATPPTVNRLQINNDNVDSKISSSRTLKEDDGPRMTIESII